MGVSLLSAPEVWDRLNKNLKESFMPNILKKVTDNERQVQEAIDRIVNVAKFSFTVKGFTLRTYQRMVARFVIISELPWIVGKELWKRQSQPILMNIGMTQEYQDCVFITITGRRFGKSRVLSIVGVATAIFAADYIEGLSFCLFANNLAGAKRLLQAVAHILELTKDQHSHLYIVDAGAERR
jgi:hypothetical protein